jgi:hypothetical protein
MVAGTDTSVPHGRTRRDPDCGRVQVGADGCYGGAARCRYSSKSAQLCCIEGKCGGRLGSEARGGPEDLTRRFIPAFPSQRCWKSCDARGFPSRTVEGARFRARPATPDMTVVPRIAARTPLDEPASEGCRGGPACLQRGYSVRHWWRGRPRSRSPSGHRTGESATWAQRSSRGFSRTGRHDAPTGPRPAPPGNLRHDRLSRSKARPSVFFDFLSSTDSRAEQPP